MYENSLLSDFGESQRGFKNSSYKHSNYPVKKNFNQKYKNFDGKNIFENEHYNSFAKNQ